MVHRPVLQKEVLEYLRTEPNKNFIDCTINGGGHALAILERIGPEGRVLGIDKDEEVISNLRDRERLILVNDSFENLKMIASRHKFAPVQGVLFDLGMSSWHLEKSGRGFSFMKSETLDMRYGGRGITAEEIVNEWPEQEIEKILSEYGEERFSKKIAKEIIRARKQKIIKSTFQLVEIIKRGVPYRYLKRRIHPATKTFQALRIAVNSELNALKEGLEQSIGVVASGGRIVVISFHSLEDRIVKNFFKENGQYLKILTKKPITPGQQEIETNPRARSAKLRAAEKL